MFGLGLNASAVLLMGLVDAYWMLLALAVLAGLGNSVFHSADYAIINGSVAEKRLGRAFSIHTFSGFLGGACAPVSILLLSQWTDWRVAMMIVGGVGLVALLAMAGYRDLLRGEEPTLHADLTDRQHDGPITSPVGVRLLVSPPILLFLVFFILYGMSSGGLIAFIVTGLIEMHGIGIEDANSALSGHLFGVVGGILLAGLITDRFPKHLVTAAASLTLAAAASVLAIIVPASGIVLMAIMTICGIGLGAVLPARDLMLRALTPPGQMGKVSGFVFVGYSLGVSVTPILFGWFMDISKPELVFGFARLFALFALVSTVSAHRMTPSKVL